MRAGTFVRALAAAVFLVFASSPSFAANLTVFAASSLSDALQKIGASYKAAAGKEVAFSFAASSALARQIEASSGADIFISADSEWMDYLDTRGLVDGASRKNLLGNHLVLVAPADSKLTLTIAPHFDILGALNGGRLALADPDSVPAGKYARSALTKLGVWNAMVDHVAGAENVRVALAYVARGEAPLGIVYTTDAISEPKVKIIGTFADSTHQPIVYPAAALNGAKPEAKAFLNYLGSPAATEIFRNAGFVVLGADR